VKKEGVKQWGQGKRNSYVRVERGQEGRKRKVQRGRRRDQRITKIKRECHKSQRNGFVETIME